MRPGRCNGQSFGLPLIPKRSRSSGEKGLSLFSADRHCLVEKKVIEDESGERTISELRVLADTDRRLELASMSRGKEALDEGALQEADRLL